MFDFSDLKAAAVNNNNSSSGKTPSYKLPIEEARVAVKIGDGNKKPAADGSQALTLTIGRVIIALDAIEPKATRVNATAAQVDLFTNKLHGLLEAGLFDEAIKAAQAKADPANKKKKATAPTAEELKFITPTGVDMTDIPKEEPEEEPEEKMNTLL
jgi:hypothetical protein